MIARLFGWPRWLGVALVCTACGDAGAIGAPKPPSGGSGPVAEPETPPPVAAGGQGGTWSADNPDVIGGQSAPPPAAPMLMCKGLQCQQQVCASGSTTITGRVYDPAGRNPLYNITVFVPNEPLKTLALGASCAKCDSLYADKVVVSALTDAEGRFVLKDAPAGTNIPLVVQVGKWRKQLVLPAVTACQDNALPDKQITLPKNHAEGDIPRIAISTGSADTLECLLRRIGVDASEYTQDPSSAARIHIYQGSPGNGGDRELAPNTSPAALASPTALWNSLDSLMRYDIVLLSCEGRETSAMQQQALHDYASAGGRVFASHFHYSWFNSGPYGMENLASWSPGSNSIGDIEAAITTSFPKGQALSDWLQHNGALTNGFLPISEARHNADVSPNHTPSQTWISAGPDSETPNATQYFSFNTPTDAKTGPDDAGYCGRVVFSDLHVGAASGDDGKKPVPTGCGDGMLSPQEKALEFMLFDLSACVIPDDKVPVPPPVLD